METTEKQSYDGLDLKADDNRYDSSSTRDHQCESECVIDTNG